MHDDLKKKVIILCIIIFVVLLIIFYYFGLIFKKTCTTQECFEDSVGVCSPVKFDNRINNNIYHYEIYRSLGANCKININLLRSSEGTDFDTKGRLEGKSMKCLIPKDDLATLRLTEVNNLLKYCSGPLKEGIYEIIIKNMYTIIINNLGEILGDVQTSLIRKI